MVVHIRTLGGSQQGTKKTNFWADTLSMLKSNYMMNYMLLKSHSP